MAARLEAPSLMPHGPQRKGERFSLPHIHRPTKTYQRSAGKSPANAQSRRFAESQQAPAAQILIHSTSRAARAPTRCMGSRRASKSGLNLAMRIIMEQGKKIGDITYKQHLDGYDQTDLITGKGPSKRNEIWYFTETTLAAARIGDFKYRFTDQPSGWFGNTTKVDWPIVTNLRLDPYERTGLTVNAQTGSVSYLNWYMYEFWRGVFVQQETEKLGQTFVDF